MLDGVLPPALGVGVARGLRQGRDGVERRVGRLVVVLGAVGEDVDGGQVGEPHRDAVLGGPPERDPLG